MMMTTIKQNIGPLIVGVAVGFALAEGTTISLVTRHDVEISQLAKSHDFEASERKAADTFLTQQISDDRIHNDRAMSELVQLSGATIKHADELISLLRLQNQLNGK